MRTIGQCELALELACDRALERRCFGRHLAEQANVQEWIAHSRLEIDQARLLVLRAAWSLDKPEPPPDLRAQIAAIKVVAARLQTQVVDRAMQVFGAMGLSPDTPLAWLWTWGRALRFLDGRRGPPAHSRPAEFERAKEGAAQAPSISRLRSNWRHRRGFADGRRNKRDPSRRGASTNHRSVGVQVTPRRRIISAPMPACAGASIAAAAAG